MVSIRFPFPILSVFFPSMTIIISISVTFMFHYFLCSCLSFCFLSLSLSFLIIITVFGLRALLRWSVCMSKSQRIFYVSFSRTDSRLYTYHLVVCQNWNSCTIPSGSPVPPSRVYSYIPFALVCCIHIYD